MQWLYPAGAWGFVSLAVITALYLLRRRSESVTVPSLLLWQRAAAEQQAMRPFQKLKRNILYFLQMALAFLLVLALMRPAVKGGVRGETVMIFDLSASMQAQESGESRLQTARRKALALLEGMGEGDRVTVLAAGDSVETRLSRSADLLRVRGAIEALEPLNGGADMEAAVSLAQAMARDMEGLNIIVFSDTYENGEVQVVRTGTGADNRAILSLSVSAEGQAFVRVANYGEEARLTVECASDGRLTDVVTLEMGAGETRSALMQAEPGAQTVRAALVEKDAILTDNERWYAARGEESYRVALCADNVFLEKALMLREDAVLLRAAPEEAAALENIDLYVFDGALPEALPERGALLCVAPDRPVAGIAPGEAQAAPGRLQAAAGETAEGLCRHLLLQETALRAFTPLAGGEAVLRWGGSTLLAVSREGGRRAAVLGFDLHDSNLPMLGDFPVLMQNLLGYLLPEMRQALADGACGAAVSLPEDSRALAQYIATPSGRRLQAHGRLEDTGEQGVYILEAQYADGETRTARFTLHMAGTESDVRRVGGAGSAGMARGVQAEAGSELTLWVLLAFLALLLVEWEVSRRVA